MRLKNPVEIFYYWLMRMWEIDAPKDGKQGWLNDGNPARNTQMSRMAYILKLIAAGDEDRTFRTLSRYIPRNDGQSYISKDPSWMKQPVELYDGWYFEGCTNLQQKQFILQNLTKLGLSSRFAACVDDFVAYKSIEKYYPTREERNQIWEQIQKREQQEE